jgi:hypothetical protein
MTLVHQEGHSKLIPLWLKGVILDIKAVAA